MAALHWVLIVCLSHQLVNVQAYTLYRWIIDSSTRFNYDPSTTNNLGVNNWRYTFPESCGGEQQSPINIQTDRVRYGQDLPCPRMLYTTTLLHGELKNNGHSATFEPQNESSFRLTNIPYRPGVYNMNDFHLHYGGVRGRTFEQQGQRFRGSGVMSAGSEHTIDGLRFEGELHFVFYNSKYKDLEAADNKTDGVVIVVLLVQKLPGNTVDSGETSIFSEFLDMNIPRIAAYQQNVTLDVDLSMFFNRGCQFYTYFGSTTTPVCHESVQWFILRQPIRVTEKSWFQLTRLQSRGDFNARFGNYRNTQPMNNRMIEANFPREMGPILPSPNSDMVQPRSENMAMSNTGLSNMGMQAPSQFAEPFAVRGNNGGEQMANNLTMLRRNNLPMKNQVNQINLPPQMAGSQSNNLQMFNNGIRTPSQRAEPSLMIGNIPRESMTNNQNLFSSIRPSNLGNQFRPDVNQIMSKDMRLSDKRKIMNINSNFQYPPMKGHQGNQMMIPHFGVPSNSPRQINPELFQNIPLQHAMNKPMKTPRSQAWMGRNNPMKDSARNGNYAQDFWKMICELWKRKIY